MREGGEGGTRNLTLIGIARSSHAYRNITGRKVKCLLYLTRYNKYIYDILSYQIWISKNKSRDFFHSINPLIIADDPAVEISAPSEKKIHKNISRTPYRYRKSAVHCLTRPNLKSNHCSSSAKLRWSCTWLLLRVKSERSRFRQWHWGRRWRRWRR